MTFVNIRLIVAGACSIALALPESGARGSQRGSPATPLRATASDDSPLYRSFPESKYIFDDMEDVYAWESDVLPWRKGIEKIGRMKIASARCQLSKYNAKLARLPIEIAWNEGVFGNMWDPWLVVSAETAQLLAESAKPGLVTAKVEIGEKGFQGQKDQVVFLDLRFEAAGQSLPISNRIQREVQIEGHIASVSLSNDGRRALIGLDGGGAVVFDVEAATPVRRLGGAISARNPATLSADGCRALVGTKLWDAENVELLREIPWGTSTNILSVSLSADGRRALTLSGTHDHTAALWDAESGKQICAIKGQGGMQGPVSHAVLSGDGKRILTWHWSNTAVLWNADTGEQLQSFRERDVSGVVHSLPNRMALTLDGRLTVLSFLDSAAAVLWNTEEGIRLHTLQGEAAHSKVAITPDGSRILTGADYGMVASSAEAAERKPDDAATLWDAQSGKPILTLRSPKGPLREVALRADARRALTGMWKGTVIVWDTE